MDAAEKERKMFWSVQPPRGIVRGEYYFENYSFGGKNGLYSALIDLVIDKGRIVPIVGWTPRVGVRFLYADFTQDKST